LTPTRPLRIGLAYPGDPEAAQEWSGIPLGLANAFRGRGVDVTALPAQPPRAAVRVVANLLPLVRLHRFPGATLRERARVSRTVALHTGPEMGLLRTRALRPRLSRALPLDAVVQVWTSYRLRPSFGSRRTRT
jgi:hypothetical protein